MPAPSLGAIPNYRAKLPARIPRGYQHSLKVYEDLIVAEAG